MCEIYVRSEKCPLSVMTTSVVVSEEVDPCLGVELLCRC